MRRPVFLFRNLLLLAGLLLFLPISLAHAASAEHRVALVIGQSAYRAVPALPNAENDGKRMAELLTNAGFEVTAAPDLAQNDMRQTFSDFAAKVAASGPDTIALVFYAGHGLQIDGENYGADRCRSETRSRYSAAGRPAQRSLEHVRGAADPDAHHHARCLPQ